MDRQILNHQKLKCVIKLVHGREKTKPESTRPSRVFPVGNGKILRTPPGQKSEVAKDIGRLESARDQESEKDSSAPRGLHRKQCKM